MLVGWLVGWFLSWLVGWLVGWLDVLYLSWLLLVGFMCPSCLSFNLVACLLALVAGFVLLCCELNLVATLWSYLCICCSLLNRFYFLFVF